MIGNQKSLVILIEAGVVILSGLVWGDRVKGNDGAGLGE